MQAGEHFHPVSRRIQDVVRGVTSDQMDRRTPCTEFDVRALVGHLLGSAEALRRFGAGEPPDPRDPWGNAGAPVTESWQDDLCTLLGRVADAWAPASAWRGDAFDGAVPRAVLGQMALGEVVLHGWDLARATDQPLPLDPAEVETMREIIDAVGDSARAQGAFGPRVPVGPGADAFDHVLGGSGRDPGWA